MLTFEIKKKKNSIAQLSLCKQEHTYSSMTII